MNLCRCVLEMAACAMKCSLVEKGNKMNELEREVVIALADNRMNLTNAALAMCKHRNSLIYHIQKIKRKTGLDSRDFHDLCKLYAMAIGERDGNGNKA